MAAYKDFLVDVMISRWTFFGGMTLVTETFIGVTLMLGLFTRLGALDRVATRVARLVRWLA